MKKLFVISIAIILAFVMVAFVVFGVLKCEIKAVQSPTGDYQIVSWLIDKGGFGYSGAYYIKEKGIFSKWYKLGTGPFSCEWLSETEFSIDHSNPIDGNPRNFVKENYYKVYKIDEFFK